MWGGCTIQCHQVVLAVERVKVKPVLFPHCLAERQWVRRWPWHGTWSSILPDQASFAYSWSYSLSLRLLITILHIELEGLKTSSTEVAQPNRSSGAGSGLVTVSQYPFHIVWQKDNDQYHLTYFSYESSYESPRACRTTVMHHPNLRLHGLNSSDRSHDFKSSV